MRTSKNESMSLLIETTSSDVSPQIFAVKFQPDVNTTIETNLIYLRLTSSSTFYTLLENQTSRKFALEWFPLLHYCEGLRLSLNQDSI
jgi:hypothetical protein